MKPTAPRLYHFLGFNTQGDVGGYTCYTARDKGLVIYPATSPKKPQSRRQLHQRNRLRLITLSWHALDPDQRGAWNAAAVRGRLRISGYNLFTYTMLTADRGIARTIEHQTRQSLYIPTPIPI